MKKSRPKPSFLIALWIVGGSTLLAGCASFPEASVQPAAECRIVPSQPASLGRVNPKAVDRMDQIRAINEFARFEAATRNLDPRHQIAYEELLRECNR